MKRVILPLCLFITSLVAAQTPVWYELGSRNAAYPVSTYFSGFAIESLTGKSLSVATQRATAAARVEAVSTIQVLVQNTTMSNTSSTMFNEVEQLSEQFSSNTTLTVETDIPGLKVETYNTGYEVAAFAYVKRRDLQRQLEKRITAALTRIETKLSEADELIANGQKMQARQKVTPLSEQFTGIIKDQKLLIAVDPEADEETLQIAETRALQVRCTKLQAALKNGINIFMDCQADLLGSPYTTLKEELKGKISDLQCTFVDGPSDADWVIRIQAKAKPYNTTTYGNNTQYFAYVDAKITITKVVTNQQVYANEISEKGAWTMSYAHAARDGYKSISNQLCEIIKMQIKQ